MSMGRRMRAHRMVLAVVGLLGSSLGLATLAPTAGAQVTGVSVSVNSSNAGNTGATWSITFTAGQSLSASNQIVIGFPSGITVTGAGISDPTELGCGSPPLGSPASAAGSGSQVVVTLTAQCSVTAGTPTTVTLTGISAVAGTYAQSGFSVSTTFETAVAASGSDIVIDAPVTYNAVASDGTTTPTGSAPTDANSPYAANSTVTVLGNTGALALAGYTFAGWCTTDTAANPSTCAGTTYAANATFSITTDVNLYSLWTPALTAANGSGTATVSPTSVVAGSSGKTLSFTYTAAAGGLNSGEVDITVPSGWTAPTTANAPGCTTASTGALSIGAGQVIQVSALTLAGNPPLTVTYGATSGGNCGSGDGVPAPSAAGSATFTTKEKSTTGGTLTAISSSPIVSVNAATPAGPSAPAPVKIAVTAALPASVAPSTSATNATTLTLEDANGIAAIASSPTTILLSANPAAGATFSASSGGPSVSSVTIPAGSSSVTVYFGDANPGTVTVTAQAGVLADVSEVEHITEPVVSYMIFLTARRSVPVKHTVTVTATVRTTTSGSSSTRVPDASANVVFSISGPDAGQSLRVTTDSAAVATATFTNDGKPGTDVVTASLAGSSAAASASVEITATAPGRPSIISATPGNSQVTVKFSPPASDGGAPITSYLVTATDETNPSASTTSTAGQSPITVTGLVNGDQYSITVHASNSVGPGQESKPKTAVPTACAGLSGNGALVCALYEGFLGRTPDFTGGQHWGGLLKSGVSVTDVASGILASPEYRSTLVDSLYQRLLDRRPPARTRSFFVDQLQSGVTDTRVASQIAASMEFRNSAPNAAPACSALTGDRAFICALYERFLGRKPAEAGMAFYMNYFNTAGDRAGTYTEVAQAFAESTEAFDTFVADAYRKLLGRSPTAAEQQFYVGGLQGGATEEKALATIAGSKEFYSHVAG